MRGRTITAALITVSFIGLILLLYPSFSDWYNSFRQSQVVIRYAERASKIDPELYEQTLQAAIGYNEEIAASDILWEPTEEELKKYDEMLSITDDGAMAYIEIPKINVFLPIYHGTSDAVLQTAIGHIAGSSLPVGGESTHCLLSGHRGMANARLFTDLDLLEPGDTFTIRTLNEVLSYEVDKINLVYPYDFSQLRIQEGEDRCTLITCAPYGINTHRLLVHAHRIRTLSDMSIFVTADALQLEPRLVAIGFAAPVLLGIVLELMLKTRKRKR